jgi:hypothetical protein
MTTLAEVIDFIDDPSAFKLEHEEHELTFHDDYGLSCGSNGEWFLAGYEFGASVLIHSSNFSDAWDTWIDECKTIPVDEMTEAYGIDDTPEMAAWKETHPAPQYFSTEWAAWCAAKATEAKRILKDCEPKDGWELIEGYEYQSNATGTGIVDVGHYAWMREADLSEITITRKEKDENKAKASSV